MPLRFDTNRGYMHWPYNPQYIGFNSTKLLVEHEYPHRQGAETEDMGRKAVRVEVRGIFLEYPTEKAPKPEILINNLWRLHDVGAVGKVYGSELGEAVEGKLFRIYDLKGSREEGTVGDIPYSFTFVEHTPAQSSKAASQATASAKKQAVSKTAKASNGGSKPQYRDMIYVVKYGDTLWDLAKDKYKDASKYKQIMLDNKVDISDMKPGLKLVLKGVPVHA